MRAGASRSGSTRALAPLALLALAPALGAAQVDGRAIVSYQTVDSSAQSAASLNQTYDLRVQQRPSQAIDHRLSLRYEGSRGEAVNGGARVRSGSEIVQPAAEVGLRLGSLTAGGGYEYRWMDAIGPGNDRTLDRARAAGTFAPEGLPVLALDGERSAARDGRASLHQVNTRAGLGVSHQLGSWQLTETNRIDQLEDRVLGFQRRQLVFTGSVGWSTPESAGQRLGGGVRVNASASRMTEELRSPTSQDIPREVTAARGLYAWDDSPLDASDRPLAPVPALVDSDLGGSAGVPVGLGGVSFQAVGVDMGRFVALDRLRVYVRDAAGNPLPTNGLVTWTGYTSDDGVAWVVAPGSRSTYHAPLGYYEIAFDPRTARYFKAVSFGVTTVVANVTEIQASVTERFVPMQQRESWNVLAHASGNAAYRLDDRTTLTYVGLSALSRTRAPGAGSLLGFDLDQTLGVTHGVRAGLTLEGAYQDRRVFPGRGGSARTDTLASNVRFTPIPALSHGLGVGWQTERGPSRAVDSTFVTLTNRARVYPTLELGADAGFTHQSDRVGQRAGDRYAGGGTANARLTPALNLVLAGSWSYARDTVAPIAAGREDRYSADASWRASPQLMLGAFLGWIEGRVSGLQQRYGVHWDPFRGGAVQVGLSYDEDLDTVTGNASRRLTVTPRWRLNRHASIDLSYALFTRNTGPSRRTELVYLTFTATL